MKALVKNIWHAIVGKIKQLVAENESRCRKCAVCHHVCTLINNKAGAREE